MWGGPYAIGEWNGEGGDQERRNGMKRQRRENECIREGGGGEERKERREGTERGAMGAAGAPKYST